MKTLPNYKFVVGDSTKLLKKIDNGVIPVIVTGLPDIEELGMSDVDEYLNWFEMTAELILHKTSNDGYAVFIQTDRKINGMWIDKSYHLSKVADSLGFKLMWHKICLNRPVGSANLHRPTYSHLLAFSKSGRPGNGLPDVIEAKNSDRLYDNATPMVALQLVMDFLKNKMPKHSQGNFPYQIVDPFVGMGSVVYMALKNGFSAIGIDIDADQIDKSEELIQNMY